VTVFSKLPLHHDERRAYFTLPGMVHHE
jgi:hypothetical protein